MQGGQRTTVTDQVLDNIVWHSLLGSRSHLGTVIGEAGRFRTDVAFFGALTDDPGPEAWDQLATLVGPGRATSLFRPALPIPDDWTLIRHIPSLQIVSAACEGENDERLVPLLDSDVPEMEDLVARTQPGPFLPRTIEFGGYVGIRAGGRLVAMAGERLSGGGWTEISAVCTDEEHRGQGLATKLVRALVHRIRARGEEAFLHTAADNETAIRLYLQLGFEVRRDVDAVIIRAPGGK